MKSYLLKLLLISFITTNSQTIQQATLSQTENGINVELKIFGQTITTFVTNNNSINGNQITLNTCYYTTFLTAFSLVVNNFPISLPPEPSSYTLTINVYNSNYSQVCDYYEMTDSLTYNFSTPIESPITLSSNNFNYLKDNFIIYPNPSNGIFKINSTTEINSITIYDSMGRNIKQINSNENEVNLTNLSKGIYFIKILSNHQELTQKIILN